MRPILRTPAVRIAGVALAVTLSSLAIAPTTAAAEVCASAVLSEPFALPDGSRHPAGRLRLCVSRDHTPTSTLHATYVDGEAVGMFAGHREDGVGALDGSAFLFVRGRGEVLRLTGLSVHRNGRTETYSLEPPARVVVEQAFREIE